VNSSVARIVGDTDQRAIYQPPTAGDHRVWVRHCLAVVVATDLDTEHGGTDANKRDGARQVGRLNVAGLRL
jgi:hypothetical protein